MMTSCVEPCAADTAQPLHEVLGHSEIHKIHPIGVYWLMKTGLFEVKGISIH